VASVQDVDIIPGVAWFGYPRRWIMAMRVKPDTGEVGQEI